MRRIESRLRRLDGGGATALPGDLYDVTSLQLAWLMAHCGGYPVPAPPAAWLERVALIFQRGTACRRERAEGRDGHAQR